MKRLTLVLMVVCLLVPASVFAQQGAGAFLQGFAQGFGQARGYCPPPVQTYQPPPVQQPQTTTGTIYGPNNQMSLYSITRTPITNSFFGTIYGTNGLTTFQGTQY